MDIKEASNILGRVYGLPDGTKLVGAPVEIIAAAESIKRNTDEFNKATYQKLKADVYGDL